MANKLISPMNLVTLFLGIASVSLGVLSLLDRRVEEDEEYYTASEEDFYGYQ